MNAPTLIVGLGGNGCKIITKVSKMLNSEEKNNIQFVAMDTDVNDLIDLKRENPKLVTIQTSTKQSIGEYLENDKKAKEDWFPVNSILNNKILSEGAGQVRSVSRLAFETALKAGKLEALDKAISDLFKLEGSQYEQGLRVIIVSSLAGGTGSGLILPVGLYIKHHLATRYNKSSNIVRGFFTLPEVFYSVIPGIVERNSLKCNAYATLRELDAFMMKGDGTLPDKYKNSVTMKFPIPGTNNYVEYNERPYDYCFLYDAQNIEGQKLNNFAQYMEHIAQCIYSQSIGPMNKKSNSSEDNTIKLLARESGRNRYAGAGSSILEYPIDDIKEYIALNWAKECISKQWLEFDEMFEEELEIQKENQKNGVFTSKILLSASYVRNVENSANENELFANEIVNACTEFTESGDEKSVKKWEQYINGLDKKVEDDYLKGDAYLQRSANNANEEFKKIEMQDDEKVEDKLKRCYGALTRYKTDAEKYVLRSADSIVFQMFKSSNRDIFAKKQKLSYRVESYLVDEEFNFFHPNAIRYFLYHTSEDLKVAYEKISKKAKKINEYFETFEAKTFSSGEGDGSNASIRDIDVNKSKTTIEKVESIFVKGLIGVKQQEVIRAYDTYLANVKNYIHYNLMKTVYEEAKKYIDELSNAFEILYSTFKDKIDTINRKIERIENKYMITSGTAIRYVCASKKCLKKTLESMPYIGSMSTMTGDLSKVIFKSSLEYAMMISKPNKEKFFSELFDTEIIEFFKEQVMQRRASALDIDVIDAIEKEAEYERELYTEKDKSAYIVDVINECKFLAAPFIEMPMSYDQKHPINACTYNKYLNPDDNSAKSVIISTHLASFNGVPDADIPSNKVFFYKSYYGLRANELSKFCPPRDSETNMRAAGEYFEAYYGTVSTLSPRNSKTLSPHLNKWWSYAFKMPDLDEDFELQNEKRIYSAFFWGMVRDYFDLCPTTKVDEKNYLVRPGILRKNALERELVVSNGTPCDTLYEVLDALSIYPSLVSIVLEKHNMDIVRELDKNTSLEESELFSDISKFELNEFEKQIDENDGNEDFTPYRSVFDLTFLFKKSLTHDLYFDEAVQRLSEVIIEELSEYVFKYVGDKAYPDVLCKVLLSQFELYLKDLELEYKDNKTIYQEYAFIATCEMISEQLREIGKLKEAKEVSEKVKEKKR